MAIRNFIAIAVAPMMLVSTNAWAQEAAAPATEEPSGAFEIDAELGLHSDYRFRGLSLSDKEIELTAQLSVSHESGLYATAWASNVALNDGADDIEVDLSAGYAFEAGPVSFDVGAVYYLYPNNSDTNYVELLASVSAEVGPGTLTLGTAYAPKQENIGDEDNQYYYVSGELPIGESPVSLHGTFGIEDGAFGDKKRDWLLGASFDVGRGITATLDYVDTARADSNLGDATVVGRIAFAF